MNGATKMRRQLEYPDSSLYEFIKQRSEANPEACAIEYFSEKITYKKLFKEIDICAGALKKAGIKKGDIVTVILPNIPQAVISFYAINKIGAVASMIHPLSAKNEIAYYIQLTESNIVIALDMIADKLPEDDNLKIILASPAQYMPYFMKTAFKVFKKSVKSPYMKFNEFMKTGETLPCECGKSHDTAAILYSGGTTGKPKGIMLSNLNFNALALQSIDGCGCLSQGDRVLSVMPVFHGFGLGVCIHTVLTFGGTAVMLPQFKASEFHKLVLKYKPHVIAGVPAIYEYMLRSGFGNKKLDFIKCVISGGDSLSVSTKERLNKVLKEHGCPVGIREGYGLTECVTGTCLMPEKSSKSGSVGLPYADTYYMIVDHETGEEMPCGESGEIILRGPAVMKGYLKEDKETAATLKKREDGNIWLYTGDMGYCDEDGFIYFNQRIKRMIVSNGYNIYPQNIEEVINSYDKTAYCAVVGIPDSIHGQRVKAFVVLKDNTDIEKAEKDLRALCSEKIAKYSVPREYEFAESLPHTLVGKIAYTELIKEVK